MLDSESQATAKGIALIMLDSESQATAKGIAAKKKCSTRRVKLRQKGSPQSCSTRRVKLRQMDRPNHARLGESSYGERDRPNHARLGESSYGKTDCPFSGLAIARLDCPELPGLAAARSRSRSSIQSPPNFIFPGHVKLVQTLTRTSPAVFHYVPLELASRPAAARLDGWLQFQVRQRLGDR